MTFTTQSPEMQKYQTAVLATAGLSGGWLLARASYKKKMIAHNPFSLHVYQNDHVEGFESVGT